MLQISIILVAIFCVFQAIKVFSKGSMPITTSWQITGRAARFVGIALLALAIICVVFALFVIPRLFALPRIQSWP